MNSPAISCRDVEKRFRIYEQRATSLRETLIHALSRKPILLSRPYFAISDLNLRIEKGESVALVGTNGSGKSTVLRVIAGIYPASEGAVAISGRLAAVLELGAGFHPDLSGSDNLTLYGTALGLSRREIRERMNDIVTFANIGEFIETPVKYYSSGMVARLAFAVAMCVRPDILLLDEVLAVGDEAFRLQCLARLKSFHDQGGTLVLVSHDLENIRDLCTRVVWMKEGRIHADGDVGTVLDAYLAEVSPGQDHRAEG
jgi:ABC-type polysaccharide/polyol phosphate transport system ATPase subunit